MMKNDFISKLHGNNIIEIKKSPVSKLDTLPAEVDDTQSSTFITTPAKVWNLKSLTEIDFSQVEPEAIEVKGKNAWIEADYVLPNTENGISLIINPNSKWILNLVGDNLVADGNLKIKFKFVVKAGNKDIAIKNITVPASANFFSLKFELDFSETTTDLIRCKQGEKITVQLICDSPKASARIYTGKTTLSLLQNALNGDMVISDSASFKDLSRFDPEEIKKKVDKEKEDRVAADNMLQNIIDNIQQNNNSDTTFVRAIDYIGSESYFDFEMDRLNSGFLFLDDSFWFYDNLEKRKIPDGWQKLDRISFTKPNSLMFSENLSIGVLEDKKTYEVIKVGNKLELKEKDFNLKNNKNDLYISMYYQNSVNTCYYNGKRFVIWNVNKPFYNTKPIVKGYYNVSNDKFYWDNKFEYVITNEKIFDGYELPVKLKNGMKVLDMLEPEKNIVFTYLEKPILGRHWIRENTTFTPIFNQKVWCLPKPVNIGGIGTDLRGNWLVVSSQGDEFWVSRDNAKSWSSYILKFKQNEVGNKYSVNGYFNHSWLNQYWEIYTSKNKIIRLSQNHRGDIINQEIQTIEGIPEDRGLCNCDSLIGMETQNCLFEIYEEDSKKKARRIPLTQNRNVRCITKVPRIDSAEEAYYCLTSAPIGVFKVIKENNQFKALDTNFLKIRDDSLNGSIVYFANTHSLLITYMGDVTFYHIIRLDEYNNIKSIEHFNRVNVSAYGGALCHQEDGRGMVLQHPCTTTITDLQAIEW